MKRIETLPLGLSCCETQMILIIQVNACMTSKNNGLITPNSSERIKKDASQQKLHDERKWRKFIVDKSPKLQEWLDQEMIAYKASLIPKGLK